MAPVDASVLKAISAAVVALHAWLESLQRLQGRKSAPEVITAARAVREMQDAVAALAQNDDRGPRPLRP